MRSEPHNDLEPPRSELAEMAGIAKALRADLEAAAERPPYFWARQQAQIRERIAVRPTMLRWSLAGMAALAALSFALLSVKTSVPSTLGTSHAQAADADDLLLNDIQHALAHRSPEALMPATVLVQEMTSHSNREQKRDN